MSGSRGHRAPRAPSGARRKKTRDQLAVAVRSFGGLSFRAQVVLCGYQRQPTELDVALVVSSVSDQRKCAQHRLPELKACKNAAAIDRRGRHTRPRPVLTFARPRCPIGCPIGCPTGCHIGCHKGGDIYHFWFFRPDSGLWCRVECRVPAGRRWSQPRKAAWVD